MARPLSKSSSMPSMPKRVFFLNRTSDVLGSFTKTDLESYSNLIRRKVQERCATTQDLMSTIRRIKTGEAGYVTPNEFRFTLIKLGITLPQPVVNDLFNMFDSDRSGTMDFDEFAMWIMNSEFRPPEVEQAPLAKEPTDMGLRRKYIELISECPSLFNGPKQQYNFLELVSEVNRKNLRSVTERDVRTMFNLLDRKKTNSVEMNRVKKWAETGTLDTPPSSAKLASVPNLRDALIKVCGSTPDFLVKAFDYARGQRNVHFDEFRRTLLSCGLGQKNDDIRALFLACGGASGSADIDLLLETASTLPVGQPAHAGMRVRPAFAVPSKADRQLRQGIRRVYDQLKISLDSADSTKSGYMNTDTLYQILQKHVMPMSHQDFRYIVRKVQTDPSNSDRYDWHHFLQIYDPLGAPHELSGGATAVPSPPSNRKTTGEAKHPYRSNPNSQGELAESKSDTLSDSTKGVGPSTLHDIKRVWIAILRSCQRADPNKSGYINRTQFIAALQKNLHQSMNSETMSRLADSYQRPDGLIDYKSCFRNTLSDLANVLPVGDDRSQFKAPEPNKGRSSGPVHPWDFDYIKQQIVHFDDPVIPHWKTACLKPKARPSTTSAISASTETLQLSPLKKVSSRGPFSADEGEEYLSRYDQKVRSTCSSVVVKWKPVWKQLMVDFHDSQVKNYPGNITTDHLLEVLSKNGIRLTKNEYGVITRYFRAIGLNDVVNYSEFLKCCNICRKLDSLAATS